jgi:hypothetical protein
MIFYDSPKDPFIANSWKCALRRRIGRSSTSLLKANLRRRLGKSSANRFCDPSGRDLTPLQTNLCAVRLIQSV